MPAVSIITPAFNADRFIAQTLESVTAQTYQDYELIVVDDGSTDGTAAVVESYMRQDRRIHLIRQHNRGMAAARNVALARARGTLCALLDSDDIWFPWYLAEQLDVLARCPDVAVLSANAINLGGSLDGQPLLVLPRATGIRSLSLAALVRAEDSMSIFSVFRREVVDAIGGFDVTLRRSEDYDLWLRAAQAGFRIAFNPRPLGLYRRHPDSVSADELLMLTAIKTPLAKLRDRCVDRPEIQALIDRQLASFDRRAMLANARTALLQGDMAGLTVHFAALADTTGAVRYRVARWLTDRAPVTIRWAYQWKRTLGHLTRTRRRVPPSVLMPRHLSRRAEFRAP